MLLWVSALIAIVSVKCTFACNLKQGLRCVDLVPLLREFLRKKHTGHFSRSLGIAGPLESPKTTKPCFGLVSIVAERLSVSRENGFGPTHGPCSALTAL